MATQSTLGNPYRTPNTPRSSALKNLRSCSALYSPMRRSCSTSRCAVSLLSRYPARVLSSGRDGRRLRRLLVGHAPGNAFRCKP